MTTAAGEAAISRPPTRPAYDLHARPVAGRQYRPTPSSSPERNWNVTFGASKLDGWLIAARRHLQRQRRAGRPDAARPGFKMGWAILVQSGNATTIPSEAGGICQVVDHAVPPGLLGRPADGRAPSPQLLDQHLRPAAAGHAGPRRDHLAARVGLQFKNTTGNWLLIRAKGDQQEPARRTLGHQPRLAAWR